MHPVNPRDQPSSWRGYFRSYRNATNRFVTDSPIVLTLSDSQAALALLKERQHKQATHHIETMDLKMQEWVVKKQIAFEFVPFKLNWADCLVKALPRRTLELCMAGMGVHRKGYMVLLRLSLFLSDQIIH